LSARLRGKASAYSKKTAKKPREEAPPPEPEVKEQSLEQAIQESYAKYSDFFPDSYVQRLQSRGIIEKPQVRAKRPSPQQRTPEPPKPIIPEARAEVITPDETLTPEYWETRARGQFDFMPGQNIGIQSTGPLATPQAPPPQQPTDRVGIVRQQLQDDLSDQQRKLQETLEIIRIERARVRSTSNDASVDTENEATMRKLSPRYTQLAAERESLLADINDIQNQITLLDADIEQRASEAQSGAFDPLESAGQSFSGIPADNPMENPKGLAPVTVPAETPAARARATGTTGTIVDPNFTLGDFSKDAIKFMGIPTTEGIPGMALSQREQEQQSFIPTAYAEEQPEQQAEQVSPEYGPLQDLPQFEQQTEQETSFMDQYNQAIANAGQQALNDAGPTPFGGYDSKEQQEEALQEAIVQSRRDYPEQFTKADYSASPESTMDQSVMELAGYERLGDGSYIPMRVGSEQGFFSASPEGGIIGPRQATVSVKDPVTGEVREVTKTSTMQVGGIDPTSPEGQVIQQIYARQAKDRFENLKQREYITALRDGKVSFREALTEPRTTQAFITGGVKTPGVNPERIANIEQFFNERGISMDETMRSLNLRGERVARDAVMEDPTKAIGDLRDLITPATFRRFDEPEFPATGISPADQIERDFQTSIRGAVEAQKTAITKSQKQLVSQDFNEQLQTFVKDNNWDTINTPDTEWTFTYLPDGETLESLREKQQEATLSSWTDEALLDEFGVTESVKYSELPSTFADLSVEKDATFQNLLPKELVDLETDKDGDGEPDSYTADPEAWYATYTKWENAVKEAAQPTPGDTVTIPTLTGGTFDLQLAEGPQVDRTATPEPGTVAIPASAAALTVGAPATAQFIAGAQDYLGRLGESITGALSLQPQPDPLGPERPPIRLDSLEFAQQQAGVYSDTGLPRPVIETQKLFYETDAQGNIIGQTFVSPPKIPFSQQLPGAQRYIDELFVSPERQAEIAAGTATGRDFRFNDIQSYISAIQAPVTNLTQSVQAIVTPDEQGRFFDPELAKALQQVPETKILSSDGIFESQVFAVLSKAEKVRYIEDDVFEQGMGGLIESGSMLFKVDPDKGLMEGRVAFADSGEAAWNNALEGGGYYLNQVVKNPGPYIANTISNFALLLGGGTIFKTAFGAVRSAQASATMGKITANLATKGRVGLALSNTLKSPNFAAGIAKSAAYIIAQDAGGKPARKAIIRTLLTKDIRRIAPNLPEAEAKKVATDILQQLGSDATKKEVNKDLNKILDYVQANEGRIKEIATKSVVRSPIGTEYGELGSSGISIQELLPTDLTATSPRFTRTALGGFFEPDGRLRETPTLDIPTPTEPGTVPPFGGGFQILPIGVGGLIPRGFEASARQREIGEFGTSLITPAYGRESTIAEFGTTPSTEFFTGSGSSAWSGFTSDISKKIRGGIDKKKSELEAKERDIVGQLTGEKDTPFAQFQNLAPYQVELKTLDTISTTNKANQRRFNQIKQKIEDVISEATKKSTRSDIKIEAYQNKIGQLNQKKTLSTKERNELLKTLKVQTSGKYYRPEYDDIPKVTKNSTDEEIINASKMFLERGIASEQMKKIEARILAEDAIYGSTKSPYETLIVNPQERNIYSENSLIAKLQKVNERLTQGQVDYSKAASDLGTNAQSITRSTLKDRLDTGKITQAEYNKQIARIDDLEQQLDFTRRQLDELSQFESQTADQFDFRSGRFATQKPDESVPVKPLTGGDFRDFSKRVNKFLGSNIIDKKTQTKYKTQVEKRQRDLKKAQAETPKPTELLGRWQIPGRAGDRRMFGDPVLPKGTRTRKSPTPADFITPSTDFRYLEGSASGVKSAPSLKRQQAKQKFDDRIRNDPTIPDELKNKLDDDTFDLEIYEDILESLPRNKATKYARGLRDLKKKFRGTRVQTGEFTLKSWNDLTKKKSEFEKQLGELDADWEKTSSVDDSGAKPRRIINKVERELINEKRSKINSEIREINDELNRRAFTDAGGLFISSTTTRDNPMNFMRNLIQETNNWIKTQDQLSPQVQTTKKSLDTLKQLNPVEMAKFGKRLQADLEEQYQVAGKEAGLRVSLRYMNVEPQIMGKTLKARLLRRPLGPDTVKVTSTKNRAWDRVIRRPNLYSWMFEVEGGAAPPSLKKTLGVDLEDQATVASAYNEDSIIFSGGKLKTDAEVSEKAIAQYKDQKVPYSFYVSLQQIQDAKGTVTVGDPRARVITNSQTAPKGGQTEILLAPGSQEYLAVEQWMNKNKKKIKNGELTLEDDFNLGKESPSSDIATLVDPNATIRSQTNETGDTIYFATINGAAKRLENRGKSEAGKLTRVIDIDAQIAARKKTLEELTSAKTKTKKQKIRGKILKGKKKQYLKRLDAEAKKTDAEIKLLEKQKESFEKDQTITVAAEELLETASRAFDTDTNPAKITNLDVLNSSELKKLKNTLGDIVENDADVSPTALRDLVNNLKNRAARTEKTAGFLTDESAKRGIVEKFDTTEKFDFDTTDITKENIKDVAKKMEGKLGNYENALWTELGTNVSQAYFKRTRGGEEIFIDGTDPVLTFAREAWAKDNFLGINYAITKSLQKGEQGRNIRNLPKSFQNKFDDIIGKYETVSYANTVKRRAIAEAKKKDPENWDVSWETYVSGNDQKVLDKARDIDGKTIEKSVLDLAQELDAFKQKRLFANADANYNPLYQKEILEKQAKTNASETASVNQEIETVNKQFSDFQKDLQQVVDSANFKSGEGTFSIDIGNEQSKLSKKLGGIRTQFTEAVEKVKRSSVKRDKAENAFEEAQSDLFGLEQQVPGLDAKITEMQTDVVQPTMLELAQWLGMEVTMVDGKPVIGLTKKVQTTIDPQTQKRETKKDAEGEDAFSLFAKNTADHFRINESTGNIEVNLSAIKGETFTDPLTYGLIQATQEAELKGGLSQGQLKTIMRKILTDAKEKDPKAKLPDIDKTEKAMSAQRYNFGPKKGEVIEPEVLKDGWKKGLSPWFKRKIRIGNEDVWLVAPDSASDLEKANAVFNYDVVLTPKKIDGVERLVEGGKFTTNTVFGELSNSKKVSDFAKLRKEREQKILVQIIPKYNKVYAEKAKFIQDFNKLSPEERKSVINKDGLLPEYEKNYLLYVFDDSATNPASAKILNDLKIKRSNTGRFITPQYELRSYQNQIASIQSHWELPIIDIGKKYKKTPSREQVVQDFSEFMNERNKLLSATEARTVEDPKITKLGVNPNSLWGTMGNVQAPRRFQYTDKKNNWVNLQDLAKDEQALDRFVQRWWTVKAKDYTKNQNISEVKAQGVQESMTLSAQRYGDDDLVGKVSGLIQKLEDNPEEYFRAKGKPLKKGLSENQIQDAVESEKKRLELTTIDYTYWRASGKKGLGTDPEAEAFQPEALAWENTIPKDDYSIETPIVKRNAKAQGFSDADIKSTKIIGRSDIETTHKTLFGDDLAEEKEALDGVFSIYKASGESRLKFRKEMQNIASNYGGRLTKLADEYKDDIPSDVLLDGKLLPDAILVQLNRAKSKLGEKITSQQKTVRSKRGQFTKASNEFDEAVKQRETIEASFQKNSKQTIDTPFGGYGSFASSGGAPIGPALDPDTRKALSILEGLKAFEMQRQSKELDVIIAAKEVKAKYGGISAINNDVTNTLRKHENANKIHNSLKETITDFIEDQAVSIRGIVGNLNRDQGVPTKELSTAVNQITDTITAKYPSSKEIAEVTGESIGRKEWNAIIEEIVARGVYRGISPVSGPNTITIKIPGKKSLFVNIEPYADDTKLAQQLIKNWMVRTANDRLEGDDVATRIANEIDEEGMAKFFSKREKDTSGALFKQWASGWRTSYASAMRDRSFTTSWDKDETINLTSWDPKKSGIAMVKGEDYSNLKFTHSGTTALKDTSFPNDWRYQLVNQSKKLEKEKGFTSETPRASEIESKIEKIADWENKSPYLENITTSNTTAESYKQRNIGQQVSQFEDYIAKTEKLLGLTKKEKNTTYLVKDKGRTRSINVMEISQLIAEESADAQKKFFDKNNFNNLPADAKNQAWALFKAGPENDINLLMTKRAELLKRKDELAQEKKEIDFNASKFESETWGPLLEAKETIEKRFPDLSEDMQWIEARKAVSADRPFEFVQKAHDFNLRTFDPNTSKVFVTTTYKQTPPSFVPKEFVDADNITWKQYTNSKQEIKKQKKVVEELITKETQVDNTVEATRKPYSDYKTATDANGNKLFDKKEIQEIEIAQEQLATMEKVVSVWDSLPKRDKLRKRMQAIKDTQAKQEGVDIIDRNIGFHNTIQNIMSESTNTQQAARSIAVKLREEKRNKEATQLEKLADQAYRLDVKFENQNRKTGRDLGVGFNEIDFQLKRKSSDIDVNELRSAMIEARDGLGVRKNSKLWNDVDELLNEPAQFSTKGNVKARYNRVVQELKALDLKKQLDSKPSKPTKQKLQKLVELNDERDTVEKKINAVLTEYLVDSRKAINEQKAKTFNFPENASISESIFRENQLKYQKGGLSINEALDLKIQDLKDSITARNQFGLTESELNARKKWTQWDINDRINYLNSYDESAINTLTEFQDALKGKFKPGKDAKETKNNLNKAITEIQSETGLDGNSIINENFGSIDRLTFRPSSIGRKETVDTKSPSQLKQWLMDNGPKEKWDATKLSAKLYEEDVANLNKLKQSGLEFEGTKYSISESAQPTKISPESLKAFIDYNAGEFGVFPSKKRAKNVSLFNELQKITQIEDKLKTARKKRDKPLTDKLNKELKQRQERVDLLRYGDNPADVKKLIAEAKSGGASETILNDLQYKADITQNRLAYNDLTKRQAKLENKFGWDKKTQKATKGETNERRRMEDQWKQLENQKQTLNQDLSKLNKKYQGLEFVSKSYSLPTTPMKKTKEPKPKKPTKKEFENFVDDKIKDGVIQVPRESKPKDIIKKLTPKQRKELEKALIRERQALLRGYDPLKSSDPYNMPKDDKALKEAALELLRRNKQSDEFKRLLERGPLEKQAVVKGVKIKVGVPGKKGKKLKKAKGTIATATAASILSSVPTLSDYVSGLTEQKAFASVYGPASGAIQGQPLRSTMAQAYVPKDGATPLPISYKPDYNNLLSEVIKSTISPKEKTAIVSRAAQISRLDTAQIPGLQFTPATAFRQVQTPRQRQRLEAVPVTKPKLLSIAPQQLTPVTTPKTPFRPIVAPPPPPGFFLPPYPTRKRKKKDKSKKKKLKKLVWQVPDNPFGYYNPQEYAVQGSKAFKKYSKVQAIDL